MVGWEILTDFHTYGRSNYPDYEDEFEKLGFNNEDDCVEAYNIFLGSAGIANKECEEFRRILNDSNYILTNDAYDQTLRFWEECENE